MNIGKSMRIMLAKRDKDPAWLASKMGITPVRVRAIMNQSNMEMAVVKRIADSFDMKVSEFIAEGE